VAGKASRARGRCSGPEVFLRSLYGQAARRWLFLAIALGFLFSLGLYAGHVRTEGAIKRHWAVVFSRVLAGAGAFFFVRLLLFSFEERVPILVFDLGAPEGRAGATAQAAGWIDRFVKRGYEIVPLENVVDLVRERRYVPKRCLGVVIEAGDAAGLAAVARAFPPEITVLLPVAALDGPSGDSASPELPSRLSLGVSLSKTDLPDDESEVRKMLVALSERMSGLLGREARYARIPSSPGLELRGLLKGTSYVCFLDGRGFNRFGDEPHLLRLLDATPFETAGWRWLSLRVYVDLFKGRYYAWPPAALMRLLGSGPRGV
jgi:hypothetical protein